jgi:hypothetical protein
MHYRFGLYWVWSRPEEARRSGWALTDAEEDRWIGKEKTTRPTGT